MKNRKGVTLIELLIVVLILAALSAISIPRISKSASSAKAKTCATNIDILNSAIELYNADHGVYPTDLTTITSDINLFPEVPECPITEAVYDATLVNHRIDETDHVH